MPKVSVIIPIYNSEKYIENCARSLFEQSLDDIEYIFINDFTPDNSIEVLVKTIQCYHNRSEHITIINNEINKGPGYSRNEGLRIAKGEYVIFCDSDDYVETTTYEEMYHLAKDKDADVVACSIGYYNEFGVCLGTDKYNTTIVTKDSLYDLWKLEGGIHSSSCNKLVKKEFIIKHSIYFDERIIMWDDLFVSLKYRFWTQKMYVIDKPFYHYIVHQGSATHDNIYKQAKSKILCAKQISNYFTSQTKDRLFIRSLMFLKFKSKMDLYNNLMIKKWLYLFPETNRHIWSFRSYYGRKRALEFLLVSYMGVFAWRLVSYYKKIFRRRKFVFYTTQKTIPL